MKPIFTGLIALCTVAATFAAEGQFGPAWVEGHNYKVVDGQLVDLGPAPTSTPTPAPTPSSTPAQPTIVINNNIINSTPAPVPTPAPAQQQDGSTAVQPWDFIVDVWTHYSNYDSSWITGFTQDGLTNYFGQRRASNYRIIRDMAGDSRRYSQWHATYYPETFWRESSNEYSPNWQGRMIYDHIDMRSDVYEIGVRWHHARVRFTVGYTYVNQVLKVYALTYQVLS
jgi:hypothetical protein